MRRRKITPKYVINIKAIPDLNDIRCDEKFLRIGALSTISELERSPIVRDTFPVIAESARLIGTPQVRNVGTIGGNLCNASPSADMAPCLIGLGALAKLRGVHGERCIPLEKFFMGPGETLLQTDEMLTEILVPNPSPDARGVYLKLPARTAIDIALVGVAVVAYVERKEFRIALGAVAPTPIRARRAEDVLRGKEIHDDLIEKASEVAVEEAKPISDLRGSAGYRKEMIKALTRRTLILATAPL